MTSKAITKIIFNRKALNDLKQWTEIVMFLSAYSAMRSTIKFHQFSCAEIL